MEEQETMALDRIQAHNRQQKGRISAGKLRDTFCETGILILTAFSALMIVFIFIFIFGKAWQVLKASGIRFVTAQGFDNQVAEAFNSADGSSHLNYGALGLLAGTLATTLGALVIALPMGIGTAIVIAELSPKWMRGFLQSMVRLLASIPSIIYGLIGLMVVVPFVTNHIITPDMQIKYIQYFQLDGKSMLSGIIVLGIMILPIIIALSADAITAVPKKYKEASLALGLSYWRTITKVILPAAKSGILAGVVLAIGRAVGEAIALSMVSGGVGNVPDITQGPVFLLTPVLTMASAIVNKSEAMSVPSIESALFACGVILMLTSILLSIFTKFIEYMFRRREGIE